MGLGPIKAYSTQVAPVIKPKLQQPALGWSRGEILTSILHNDIRIDASPRRTQQDRFKISTYQTTVPSTSIVIYIVISAV